MGEQIFIKNYIIQLDLILQLMQLTFTPDIMSTTPAMINGRAMVMEQAEQMQEKTQETKTGFISLFSVVIFLLLLGLVVDRLMKNREGSYRGRNNNPKKTPTEISELV